MARVKANAATEESKPLGSVSDAEREAEIRKKQDEAVEKTKANLVASEKAFGGGFFGGTEEDRKASVQQRVDDAVGRAIAAKKTIDVKQELHASDPDRVAKQFAEDLEKLGETPEKLRISPNSHPGLRREPVSSDVGDEITVTIGEERYGKPNSFSSYQVGQITSTTRVRPGETRATAYARLEAELWALRDPQREIAHRAFMNHFTKNFG